MRFVALAFFALAATAALLCGCGNKAPELKKQYADVVNAAVALVEEHGAFSTKDLPVVKFKEKYPEVVELLIVIDKKTRIALIPSGSHREEIDERKSPVIGTLHFKDQISVEFIEFRRRCSYGETTGTVLVRVRKSEQAIAPR